MPRPKIPSFRKTGNQFAQRDNQGRVVGTPFQKTSGPYGYVGSRFKVYGEGGEIINAPTPPSTQRVSSNPFASGHQYDDGRIKNLRQRSQMNNVISGNRKFLKSADKGAKGIDQIHTTLTKGLTKSDYLEYKGDKKRDHLVKKAFTKASNLEVKKANKIMKLAETGASTDRIAKVAERFDSRVARKTARLTKRADKKEARMDRRAARREDRAFKKANKIMKKKVNQSITEVRAQLPAMLNRFDQAQGNQKFKYADSGRIKYSVMNYGAHKDTGDTPKLAIHQQYLRNKKNGK
jgi:hypothetical protein